MSAIKAYSTLLLVLMTAVGGAAFAAETSIYGGQTASELGLTFSPWGSGYAEESADKTFAGGKSIKVTTEGWFEGGCIEFREPAKLFSDKPAANQFLVFIIAPTFQSQFATSGADNGWHNRASRSTAASGYDFGAESVQKPKIERFKVVLANDRGKRTEVTQPLGPIGDSGWAKVGVPLSKLRLSPGETGYNLKKVLIFSDIADTIYVGAIKVVEDSEPIKAKPGGNMSFALGDSVVFRASSTAGLSVTKASWDFNDKDGIQEDAAGEIVKHIYTKPGDFKVTLKVTDINGLKPAATETLMVHIE